MFEADRTDALLAGAKVVIVGINYSPEETGIAPYTTALAEALHTSGANVAVVTGVPHYPQWRISDPRYAGDSVWHEQIHGIHVTRVTHHVPPTAGVLGRARMEASFLARAWPRVRRHRAEAVIGVTPSLGGAVAGLLGSRGSPFGVIVQDLTGAAAAETGSVGSVVGRGIGSAEFAALRRAALVGVITPRFGQILQSAGVDGTRIRHLANFTHVTASKHPPSRARAELGWPDHGTTVVHTGNMGRKQGLESVIDAARVASSRGDDVQFVLVGDGNQRADLIRQGAGVPNLHFVDPLDAQRYPLALAAADVLLINELPGVREMSMPSKLTSYVAAGRPVVAAVDPSGITGTTLRDGDVAALVPPGDPRALLDEIIKIRSDQAYSDTLTAAAGAFGASHYTAEAAQRRYRDFAAELLSTAS